MDAIAEAGCNLLAKVGIDAAGQKEIGFHSLQLERGEFALVGCDQIFVLVIIVVADIGPEMRRDAEEFVETFNAPGEKVSPLMALRNGSAATVKVDHIPNVGIIPASKGHARYQSSLLTKRNVLDLRS